jgi:VanZ family protein
MVLFTTTLKFFDACGLVLYCLLIYWLSDQPWLPAPELFDNQDKFHHFIAYFIMGILAWRNFRHYLNKTVSILLLSLIFSSFYGVTDEWHQSFVVGRNSDIFDWLADTIGATLAVMFMSYYKALSVQK